MKGRTPYHTTYIGRLHHINGPTHTTIEYAIVVPPIIFHECPCYNDDQIWTNMLIWNILSILGCEGLLPYPFIAKDRKTFLTFQKFTIINRCPRATSGSHTYVMVTGYITLQQTTLCFSLLWMNLQEYFLLINSIFWMVIKLEGSSLKQHKTKIFSMIPKRIRGVGYISNHLEAKHLGSGPNIQSVMASKKMEAFQVWHVSSSKKQTPNFV